VSLHCPLTEENPKPDREERASPDEENRLPDQHRPRGIVDEEALIEALRGGEIAGRRSTPSARNRRRTCGALRGGKIGPDSAHRRGDRCGRDPHGVEAVQNTLTALEGKPPGQELHGQPGDSGRRRMMNS